MSLPFPEEELTRLGITRGDVALRAGYKDDRTVWRVLSGEEETTSVAEERVRRAALSLLRERLAALTRRDPDGLPPRELKDLLLGTGLTFDGVAEGAGVSRSSVYLTLNDKGRIGSKTRDQVLRVAAVLVRNRLRELLELLRSLPEEEELRRAESPRVRELEEKHARLTRTVQRLRARLERRENAPVAPKVETDLRLVASRPAVPSVLKDPHVVRGTRIPRADVADGRRHGVVWHPSLPGTGHLFLMVPVEEIETEGLAAVALLYPPTGEET